MPTIKLSTEEFVEKIFDYRSEQEWKFKGSKPAIVDFYADWCGPCKMVAPALEQLSEEYAGKVDIYKVDTDKEQEVSAIFGIQSIPSFLFIPMAGSPSMEPGAFPKHVFKQIIEEYLLNEVEGNK
jgi:thioredoxin 1